MTSFEAFLQIVAGLVGQVLDLTELRALLMRKSPQASCLHLILAHHLFKGRDFKIWWKFSDKNESVL